MKLVELVRVKAPFLFLRPVPLAPDYFDNFVALLGQGDPWPTPWLGGGDNETGAFAFPILCPLRTEGAPSFSYHLVSVSVSLDSSGKGLIDLRMIPFP